MKHIFVLLLVVLATACSHPLEIVGEGDIVSSTGKNDCLLENQPCSNIVANDYIVTYVGEPREGWSFVGWQGCGKQYPDCVINVPAVYVNQNWGQTWPPLVGVFGKGVALSWPLESAVKDTRISQPYACFDCINSTLGNDDKYHIGIDMRYCSADAQSSADCSTSGNVLSVADGKICNVITNGSGDRGFGNTVIIDHGNGLFSAYSHLQSPTPAFGDEFLCSNRGVPGDPGDLCIYRGEKLGKIGGTSSGNETGVSPHLHFGLINSTLNPGDEGYCALPVKPGYSEKHPALQGYPDPWPLFFDNILSEPVLVKGLMPDQSIRLGPGLPNNTPLMKGNVTTDQLFVARAETDEWYLVDIPCGNRSTERGTDKACSGWLRKQAEVCPGPENSCVELVESDFIVEVPAQKEYINIYKEPGGVNGKLSQAKLWRGQRVYFTASAYTTVNGTGVDCAAGQWRKVDVPSMSPGIYQTYGWVCLADFRVSALNDTGITFGGNYPSGNNAGCTGATIAQQDCSHGRDADPATNDNSDGHAGFSYTKLSSSGSVLPASATNWACVRDNVTGLVWEMKTDDGGIHDKDNRYRWGGKTAQGTGYGDYLADWNVLVDGSNNAALCGFTDWRVPTWFELQNLVDYSRVSPSIDAAWFPYTQPTYFWSSSPSATFLGWAWLVDFSTGSSSGFSTIPATRAFPYPVRLVRAGQ